MAQPDLSRLIISNLADLDAAAQHVNNELQLAVAEALDELAKTFLRNKAWAGLADWNDDAIWLAPNDWRKQGDHTGDDFLCQFNLAESRGRGDAKDIFWLTQLLGIGDRILVLRWERNDVARRRWKNMVGQQQTIIGNLRARNFVYEESEGSFYLPVRIDQSELAQAVGNESPELALAPFMEALEACFEAKSDFDNLLAATTGAD